MFISKYLPNNGKYELLNSHLPDILYFHFSNENWEKSQNESESVLVQQLPSTRRITGMKQNYEHIEQTGALVVSRISHDSKFLPKYSNSNVNVNENNPHILIQLNRIEQI